MAEETRPPTAGELKQRVLRAYNEVNQSVSGVGVRQQRVDLLGERILIVAEHQRIDALSALDTGQRTLTRQIDIALIDLYKERLREPMERAVGVGIRTILRDYDPATQLACNLIVLEREPPVAEAPRTR